MNIEERELVDGCGLFFYKSLLPEDLKIKIANWYKGLSKEEQNFIDIVREEGKTEGEYFSQTE